MTFRFDAGKVHRLALAGKAAGLAIELRELNGRVRLYAPGGAWAEAEADDGPAPAELHQFLQPAALLSALRVRRPGWEVDKLVITVSSRKVSLKPELVKLARPRYAVA